MERVVAEIEGLEGSQLRDAAWDGASEVITVKD
jgi:hypothetical protein